VTERVVIVGGTSGIGLATAQRLVDGGREVIVTGRNTAKLATALDQLGKNATGQAVDAREPAALTEFFSALGPIDHVVVTATGPSGTVPFTELTLPDLQAGVEGKLLAHTAVAHAALPVLRKDGSLTLISAASAGAAMPTTAHLAAVNAGVEAMVPVLAAELKPLRVNAVSPGVVDTPWWDFLEPEARQQAFAGIAAATPAGRIGKPEDIASAITFLIENTFTTGIVLRVDGGAQVGSGA
jgi:NAD(P)-dependent dehydrogenase (short-subunit alcohol dehydrogenase family)